MALTVQEFRVPFRYFVIDGLVSESHAHELSQEFLPYDSDRWFRYDSPLERKRTIREWGCFPARTYQWFHYLCGPEFLAQLRDITQRPDLVPDTGLHGAGWHIQGRGDHLNVHVDYSLHPRLHLQRQYNLIMYLTPDWQSDWGGDLEFWSHDPDTNEPARAEARIQPCFGRAVLFETQGWAWHGCPRPLACPEGIYRKSIAMYYLATPDPDNPQRLRARYAASEAQRDDPDIQELIQRRSRP